ncbi:hypothetical protein FRC11_010776 [Ceratobasidium sp. 423]|nr:hypothetical protein FRC11_010776 [Ceratobasidium sp. 423]
MIKNAASAATKTLAATPMYPFGVYLMGRRVESDKFGASDRVDDNGNLADRRSEYTRVLGNKMDWHENANAPKVLEPFSRDILFSYPGSNIILQDDTRELFEEYYKTGVEAGTDYPTEHGKVAKRLDTFKFDFLKYGFTEWATMHVDILKVKKK